MKAQRAALQRGVKALGISMLILSLGHTPLPKADYHNIRHHDGPGEACPLHKHLLRWHPNAGQADDVAVLHWHWFLPMPGTPDTAAGDTPAVNAAAPDWSGLSWDDAPPYAPEARSRFVGRPAIELSTRPLPTVALDLPHRCARDGPPCFRTFSATFAPHVSLSPLLQRWLC